MSWRGKICPERRHYYWNLRRIKSEHGEEEEDVPKGWVSKRQRELEHRDFDSWWEDQPFSSTFLQRTLRMDQGSRWLIDIEMMHLDQILTSLHIEISEQKKNSKVKWQITNHGLKFPYMNQSRLKDTNNQTSFD